MMEKPLRVEVRKKRKIHTYSELWHASDCVLQAGLNNPKGAAWQFLSSALLTAFTFEAYLNHVGDAIYPNWEDYEPMRPLEKLQLLCEKLGVVLSKSPGARPLQTVAKLMAFRNTMAHGKTSELNFTSVKRNAKNYHSIYGAELLADWEKMIQTSDFALRVREDVDEVIAQIHEARGDDKEPLFSFGLGHNSATLIVS